MKDNKSWWLRAAVCGVFWLWYYKSFCTYEKGQK